MFSRSPSGSSVGIHLICLPPITGASPSVDPSAAHFVPDALKRGIRLCVVLTGEHIDSAAVPSASSATGGPPLSAGGVIPECGPTMCHCKWMTVDGLLTSVGSTDFDNRSFRLNDEAMLNVVDADFARAQITVFEANLAQARPARALCRAARKLDQHAVLSCSRAHRHGIRPTQEWPLHSLATAGIRSNPCAQPARSSPCAPSVPHASAPWP